MKQKKQQLGVTSIEYGLLAALIALAVVFGVTSVGAANSDLWDSWTSQFIAAVRFVIP